MDFLYANGVIAVKERELLKDRILRLCELDAREALRLLAESGFGGGGEESAETLVLREEERLDSFIREYAVKDAELSYLLLPRDFHNVKAICKAKALGTEPDKMLAPEGRFSVKTLISAVEEGDCSGLPREMGEAIGAAFPEEPLTGAAFGALFERALYRCLSRVCAREPLLKKLLRLKADYTNLLTAARSASPEYASALYVRGGKLGEEILSALFLSEEEAAAAFAGTPYAKFAELLLSAKREGKPFTEAERVLGSFEAEFFLARKYELEREQPFLYYVFRRRAEIVNVRMIFVCLGAGMEEAEIKKRLRAVS